VTDARREFDEYADNYESSLAMGVGLSGEGQDYFARGRVARLAEDLRAASVSPRTVLDFGCGTGHAVRHLLADLRAERVIGLDVSEGVLGVARRDHTGLPATFHQLDDYRPAADVDVAFCNGVFHHIPVAERPAMVNYVYRCLRPGGVFAFWENNPWNPGTRLVMRRIPFDRTAIMLSAPAARRLLAEGGFEIGGVQFAFIFPRWLGWLRGLESPLASAPLGAQYQVFARKPHHPGSTRNSTA
jgi:SAM-dependent methyltransferase